MGDTTPSENAISGFSVALVLGLAKRSVNQYGLWPTFMTPSQRIIIAGVTTTQTDAVSVTLKDSNMLPLLSTRVPVLAVLVPLEPASNPGAEMIATMRPACLSKEDFCAQKPDFPGCFSSEPKADPCDDAGFPATHLKSSFSITCCYMPNCEQMQFPFGDTCCDCSRPECSLCQVPADGVVSYTLDFRRTGKFNIKFHAQTLHGGLHEELDVGTILTILAVSVCVFACWCVCMLIGLNMFVLVDSSLRSTPPVRMGARSGRGLGCAAARRTAPTLPRVIEIEGRQTPQITSPIL